MPEYARVVNGNVEEIRTLESIPAHKMGLWTSVVREGDGEISQTVVESNVVRIVRSHPPLDTLKTRFKARVDADAESARQSYLTPGAGMAMTYQEDAFFEPRTVILRSIRKDVAKQFVATKDRWKSFGWNLKNVEEIR